MAASVHSVLNDFFLENDKAFINHILLIFKLHIYNSGENKFIDINSLIAEL